MENKYLFPFVRFCFASFVNLRMVLWTDYAGWWFQMKEYFFKCCAEVCKHSIVPMKKQTETNVPPNYMYSSGEYTNGKQVLVSICASLFCFLCMPEDDVMAMG